MERHVDPRRPRDLLAAHVLRLSRQQADPADAVAADVHQRAAVELGQRANVREVVEGEREGRLHGAEPSDRAVGDESGDRRGLRMVAIHERLRQDEPRGVRGVERFLGLAGMARVGLLAEDVLSGRERLHRPLVVHAVRERDVDGLDVGVGEERLVGAVGRRDPVLRSVRLRPLRVAACHGDDVDPVGLRSAREDRAVDVRRRQEAESHPGTLTARRAGYSAR